MGFLTSVCIHVSLFGVWLLFGFAVLHWNQSTIEDLQAGLNRRTGLDEPALMFVEVAPEQADAVAPEKVKFYSSSSSRAANPEADIDSDIPRVEGTQEQVAKTTDTDRPQPDTLRPAPAPAEQPPALPEAPKAAEPAPPTETPPPVDGPGDVARIVPQEQVPPVRSRPRRLVDVKPAGTLLAGPQMRQEGGVKRRGTVSLDVKATPFGTYDAAVIAAIQKRWYDLLDETSLAPRAGRVVITFRLHSDGRITNLQVIEEDVGDILTILCRRAISDPAPFAPWPGEMRRVVGRDYRDLRFTFFYL